MISRPARYQSFANNINKRLLIHKSNFSTVLWEARALNKLFFLMWGTKSNTKQKTWSRRYATFQLKSLQASVDPVQWSNNSASCPYLHKEIRKKKNGTLKLERLRPCHYCLHFTLAMATGIKVVQPLNPTSRRVWIQGFIYDSHTNTYSNHNEITRDLYRNSSLANMARTLLNGMCLFTLVFFKNIWTDRWNI